MSYWGKQTSSRIVNAQVVQVSSAVAVASAAFGPQTYQIRVISPIAVWVAVGNSPTATVQSAGSVFLAANTASGDYFTVTPGQSISCISLSSATTGTVSVAEMS